MKTKDSQGMLWGDDTMGGAILNMIIGGNVHYRALQHHLDPQCLWAMIAKHVDEFNGDKRQEFERYVTEELPDPEIIAPHSDHLTRSTIAKHFIDAVLETEIDEDKFAELYPTSRQHTNYVSIKDVYHLIRSTRWVWKAWIPRGHISLLVGDPGVGKTSVAVGLADVHHRNLPWPDGYLENKKHGLPVTWLDTESALAIVASRCTAWGINMEILRWPPLPEKLPDGHVRDNEQPLWKLDVPENLERIERFVCDQDSQWVVVDSFNNSFSGDENSSEVQRYLAAVAKLAERTGTAFTFITHFNKKISHFEEEPSNVELLKAVRGSSAIAAQARSVIACWTPDRHNPDRVRMQVCKSNAARIPPPVSYEIREEALVWSTDYPTVPQRKTQRRRNADIIVDAIPDDGVGRLSKELQDELVGGGKMTQASYRHAKNKLIKEKILRSYQQAGAWWVGFVPEGGQ